MKKFLSFLLICGSCLLPCLAQNHGGGGPMPKPEDRAKEAVVQLAKKIVLTKHQQDSAGMVFTTFFEDMEMYRTDGNAQLIQALEQKRDNSMKSLLNNAAAFDKYNIFMIEMKNNRDKVGQPGGPGGEGGSGGPGGRPPQGGNGGQEPGF